MTTGTIRDGVKNCSDPLYRGFVLWKLSKNSCKELKFLKPSDLRLKKPCSLNYGFSISSSSLALAVSQDLGCGREA